MTEIHPWDNLTDEDDEMVAEYLNGWRHPDLTIAPDGEPYLYRWHLTPHKLAHKGQTFLHIQVADDPERPLHDHPWDNQSVILSGGYDELWNPTPWLQQTEHDIEDHAIKRMLRERNVVARKASEAHRLFLPKDIPYTITLFSVGPVERDWGFWKKTGWVSHEVVTEMTPDRRSIFKDGSHEDAGRR